MSNPFFHRYVKNVLFVHPNDKELQTLVEFWQAADPLQRALGVLCAYGLVSGPSSQSIIMADNYSSLTLSVGRLRLTLLPQRTSPRSPSANNASIRSRRTS